MEIKNDETKLLFNDFEDEGSKESDGEIDFCVKYKDLDLDNDKQYYCYFYEKKNGEKNFAFKKGNNPEIRKNTSGAYDVKYSCNKNCVGLRFFVAGKEITEDVAKNMSPEKNNDVTWYEVKQDENGQKYIAKLGLNETEWQKTDISFAYSNDHFDDKKQWKIGPYKKYGDHKFLTHFNNYGPVYIKCNKFKQLISNDINSSEVDADNTEFNPNVYACVKLNPDSNFYLDWSGNMKKALADDFGTGNKHNGYMEDMYTLRFYVTNKKLDINEGDKFDENELFDKNDKISVFEVRRDKSDNIVLWHLKNKGKNEWEAVDGEVIYYSLHPFMNNAYAEQITYHCTTQSENDIQKSYTVGVYEDNKKISENTVEINNTDIVDPTMSNRNNKSGTSESLSMKNNLDNQIDQSKQQSNYHIGKIIFFGLISVGVGLFWGWLYALIPVALLIVFAIWDYKCKFKLLPGPKKILSCVMPCLSCLTETEKINSFESPKTLGNEIKRTDK